MKDRSILIRKPEQHIVKYPIKFGDESILAAMSLFFPDMYGLAAPDLVHAQCRFDGHPNDPHGEFFLKHSTLREVRIEDPHGDSSFNTSHKER